jgi:hypothetical protein
MRAGIVGLALALAACGGGEPAAINIVDRDVTVSVPTGGAPSTITVRNDDGTAMTATGEGSAWPAEVAAFAPAYPGAKVDQVMRGMVAGGGAMIYFTTSDPADQVIAFYKARAAAAGMKEEAAMSGGSGRIWNARDAQRRLGITVNQGEGASNVVVVAGLSNPG